MESHKWAIFNYQIPVPLGDCSVHLLKYDGDVHKAFLMDGGKSAKNCTAEDQITKSLKAIHDWHGRFKFNAWVVTHWDEDHYAGVLDLLKTPKFYEKHFQKDACLYSGAKFKAITERAKETGADIESLPFKHRCSGKNTVGKDLFSGLTFSKTSFEDAMPQFLVLGANGYGLSQEHEVIAIQDPTTKNETSLLSVIFWPTSKICSYFTGGDGNPFVEQKIVIPWLREHAKKEKVFMLKLDHHGSSHELFGKEMALDKTIVTQLQPERIIVTPGYLYGHPTYDALAFLSHYRDGNPHLNGKEILYTTRSPYWMSKAALGGKDINLGHNANLAEMHQKDLDDMARAKDMDPVKFQQLWAQEAKNMIKAQKEWKKCYEKMKTELMDKAQNETKVTWEEVYQFMGEANKKLRKELKRSIADPSVEEPESSDFQDSDYEVKLFRECIKVCSINLWKKICRQPLVGEKKGHEFYMVEFIFDENGRQSSNMFYGWQENHKKSNDMQEEDGGHRELVDDGFPKDLSHYNQFK